MSAKTELGLRKGETEAQLAKRCRDMIVKWWAANGKGVMPDVQIVAAQGDANAIRSNICLNYPSRVIRR